MDDNYLVIAEVILKGVLPPDRLAGYLRQRLDQVAASEPPSGVSDDDQWTRFLLDVLINLTDYYDLDADYDLDDPDDAYRAHVLDFLARHYRERGSVPFHFAADPWPYRICQVSAETMAELRRVLRDFGGRYDHLFEFDPFGAIAARQLGPVGAEAVHWVHHGDFSQGALPPHVSPAEAKLALEELTTLLCRYAIEKDDVSYGLSVLNHWVSESDITSNRYWPGFLTAVDPYFAYVQYLDDVPHVLKRLEEIAQTSYDDFSELAIPEDASTYKTLSVVAGSLNHKLLGWIEQPGQAGRWEAEMRYYTYCVLPIYKADRARLEELFATCGARLRFDWDDPVRLAMPRPYTPPLGP